MTAARRIVFIDPSITDWKTLLAGLSADIEVVILNQATDGLLQIADSLRGASGVSAIHIFSHGSSGELLLGDTVVNAGNLQQYSAALATIGNALIASGDILLYGCNVAQGEVGLQFIERLGQITGADVAASTDLTGGLAVGDWVLEASIGDIGAVALFLDGSLASYSYPLGIDDYAGNIGTTTHPVLTALDFMVI